jgi:Multiubiquitin
VITEQQEAEQHGKSHTIYVNGRPRTFTSHRISYAQVVELAFPNDPKGADVVYTVAYANPHGRDGTLAEGQDVVVKDGMSFNVGKTNRS